MRVDQSCAVVESPANKWFAVRTVPRHEKRVNERLSERNIHSYLPVYRATRQWKKRPALDIELPLFPSYVFVRIPYDARSRVLSAPGVLFILGNGRQAIPVPDPEIEAIRTGIENYQVEPHPRPAIGEKVRIQNGHLAGFTGILVREKSRARVVLSVDALMQGVAVEVDLRDVAPVHASSSTQYESTYRPM